MHFFNYSGILQINLQQDTNKYTRNRIGVDLPVFSDFCLGIIKMWQANSTTTKFFNKSNHICLVPVGILLTLKNNLLFLHEWSGANQKQIIYVSLPGLPFFTLFILSTSLSNLKYPHIKNDWWTLVSDIQHYQSQIALRYSLVYVSEWIN